MRISATVDRAIVTMVELAARGGGPLKLGELMENDGDSPKFTQHVLAELRNAGLLESQRGHHGGYWLARSATEISLADIIRAVDGPLTKVRGLRPEHVEYPERMRLLTDVWCALQASARQVLERVSLDDVAAGRLPADVQALLDGDRRPAGGRQPKPA